MTARDRLMRSRAVGFDSNIAIYLVEGSPEDQALAEELWRDLTVQGIAIHMSEFGVAECLFGAHRRASAPTIKAYEQLFANHQLVSVTPLTRAQLLSAARLGPSLRLSLPDAIHHGAALLARCDCFLTNGKGFRTTSGLEVIQFTELAATTPQ